MGQGRSTASQLTGASPGTGQSGASVDQHLAGGLLCALPSGCRDQEALASGPGIEDAEDCQPWPGKEGARASEKKREEGPAELDGVALL